jgi:hypothetical protein
VAEQAIGANTLRWEANVEPDLAGYRLIRRRAGAPDSERVADLPAGATSATDTAVRAGESVTYRLIAIDADGLRSGPSDPVEIAGIVYGLRAESTASGVRLSWSAAVQAGFRETRILRGGDEIGRATEPSFVHGDGEAGDRYQLVGVRADGSEAPPSLVAEAE